MNIKKLPIGIQTFSKIREDDYLYIDKTDIAYEIINSYEYVFLSRPRRFGKSLFLDTLRNIFEGKKEYFKDLAIEPKWDWDTKYPVIIISFAEGKIKSMQDLEEKFEEIFLWNQKQLDITCQHKASDRRCFSELIRKAYEKYNQKIVVLIDEYDKPILDNITDTQIAKEIRDGLVNFYSVIKGSDEFLRFAFLTGVSKFTKTSLFSGLNNITDISLNPKFGDICGYSQNDIETTFSPYLEGVDMTKLKEWYNGYNFLGSSMYNPFGILQFIANGCVFKNYWFETGTPTFLMELIKKYNYFLPNLSNLKVDEKLLNSFDIENLDLEVILYQAGYLTIKKQETSIFDTLEYTLKIPNKEVQISLSDHIINFIFKDKYPMDKKTDIYRSLLENDMNNFELSLKSMFDSIPYNNFTNNEIQNYEGFYASVIFIYLQSLGVPIVGEKANNKGRIDLVIELQNSIYIVEFKLDGKENALEQIKQKGYANPYLGGKKEIYLVGIHFDIDERNICKFDWEKQER